MSKQRDNASCLNSLEIFLEHSMQPLIMEGLISIREQAREMSQTNSEMDEIELTVALLNDVKNWTQVLLEEEVRRILQKISFLQKLLTALFVMKVKVLSVINMRKDTEEFPLTIPANATFIHHVYIQCANILVDNRHVLEEMNLVHLTPLVQQAIRNACLACIEWSELLTWGLDGVNVNDMLSNIMSEDEQQEQQEQQHQTDTQDDIIQPDSNTEDEFANIANDEKMNNNDDQDQDQDQDQQSNSGNEDDSMFDFSEQNNNNSEADENASVGDSASQISPTQGNTPTDAQGDTTQENQQDDDSKHVSSSPSFF